MKRNKHNIINWEITRYFNVLLFILNIVFISVLWPNIDGIVRHPTPSYPTHNFRLSTLCYGVRATYAGLLLPSQKYRALNLSICLILSMSVRSCWEVATFLTNALASVSVKRSTR